jgi:hypothetical protein
MGKVRLRRGELFPCCWQVIHTDENKPYLRAFRDVLAALSEDFFTDFFAAWDAGFGRAAVEA